MMKSILYAAAISALAVSAAHAQEWRFGIEGGFASADTGADSVAQSLSTSSGRTVTFTEDSSTFAARIYGELALTDTLAAEFGIFQTGSLDVTFAAPGTTASGTVGLDARGIDVGLKYYPMDAVFFRAGVHYSEITGTGTATISGTSYTAVSDLEGFGGFIGAGVYLTENISVGLTYYDNVGGDSDADATFAFIGYRF